ncbi:MAG: protein BatD [Sedimentisphaerales bacterium]|nr:protein BatD [Sedimentisphaerales bacterium]
MLKYWIYILALIAMTFVGVAGAADVKVFASVDASKDIYAGESFTLQVIIDGFDQPGEVDLSPLAMFNPQSAGGGNTSQTSISIINGRTTTNVIKRYVMNYTLTAFKAGPVSIPPLTVTVDGTRYQTNPVEMNIVQPGTTDQLELETTLSEQKCYVGQPVVLTVKFYIYTGIGDYQFDIPALSSDAFYVEDPEGAGQPKQYRVNRRNRQAVMLTFSKVLIPRRTGEIDLGTAAVSADVAVGRARSRDAFFDDFFGRNVQYKRFAVNAKPLKLTVLPLPQQEVPEGFYGLVGRYTISADAGPTEVSVGDPITLTIKIGGEYLKPVQWPGLEQIPALADNFKIPSQKASPTIENGFKLFTQTIRASNDKVTEIPSIPLAYFDADQGKYVVAKTEPIKLEVSPTKILTTADVEGRDFSPLSREVEAVKYGLSANYEGPDCLQDVSFSLLPALVLPGYLAIWGLPLTALMVSVITKTLLHTTPGQEAKKRRRRAAGKAVGRLKKISAAQLQSNPEILAETMKQYIGDRFDKVAGSLTADDCFEVIVSYTGDSESAGRFRDIIGDCEASRYAPVRRRFDAAAVENVISFVRTIDKKSKL